MILMVDGCPWRVNGTNINQDDADRELLKDAIRNPDELVKVQGKIVPKLSQSYLMEHTGHRAPIFINEEQRTIDFSHF